MQQASEILIATQETNSTLAEKIRSTLQLAGYSVRVLNPLESQAEDNIASTAMILLLPDLRGTLLEELVKKIRRRQDGKNIVIIALLRARESIGALVSVGANDVLRLPTTDRELLFRIQKTREYRDLRREQMEIVRELEQQREKLGRYFSPKELQRILTNRDSTEVKGEAARGTFLMFDLRDSTRRAERMGAENFFPFLTELFADLSDLVHGLDGTLSKFTGDGFLAIFGCPNHSREATLNALRCATRIRAHLEVFNSLLPEGEERVRFGIGIATGLVYRGNIGNVHRLDYTVLGDAVNLASRLEQLTKRTQRDILIDGETQKSAGDGIEVQRLGFIKIRGKEQQVEVYHLQSVLESCPV